MMSRRMCGIVLAMALAGTMFGTTAAAGTPARYAPTMVGMVAGFRLAGIEPDGDPLDQVVLQTELTPSGGMPRVHLIVDSYLENFKPDTTPILPDLLNPRRTAQNLGGFLQGKVLVTDDAGTVLAIGSFLAEAFIGNSSNHAVMKLYGSGTGYGGKGALKGGFTLRKDGTLAGALTGTLTLPPAAHRAIAQHASHPVHSFGAAALKKIISAVSVQPAPMMGRATTGSRGAPLRTGFGTPKSAPSTAKPVATTTASRHLSPLTAAALGGAVVCFLIAAALWWKGRPEAHGPS